MKVRFGLANPLNGSVAGDLLCIFCLAALLAAVSSSIPGIFGFEDKNGYGLIAVVYCAFVAAGCVPWQSSIISKRYPVVAVLIPMTWRISAISGIVLWAAATKWPNLNLFSFQLVGYYFLFLTLESWLAIRKLLFVRS